MRAAQLSGPGKLSIEQVPDASLELSTDAIVRVVAAGICGTDLRAYGGQPGPLSGPNCGHEFVGVVEEIGADVTTLRRGNLVVAPFMFSDGTCDQCVRGYPTSCKSGGLWAADGMGGGQAEAVRVPFADATLVQVAMDENDERIPAILTLADVMATGYHGVRGAGRTVPATVAVVGDGATGLCAVLAAAKGGAERIYLLGRHPARLEIGRKFGATDIVTTRGAEAEAAIAEATGGVGVDLVVEAAGRPDTVNTALAICADGGTIGLTGSFQGEVDMFARFLRNVTITAGLTPARTYLPELLRQVLSGELDPSPVLDLTVSLADTDLGYQAMVDRRATKVLITP